MIHQKKIKNKNKHLIQSSPTLFNGKKKTQVATFYRFVPLHSPSFVSSSIYTWVISLQVSRAGTEAWKNKTEKKHEKCDRSSRGVRFSSLVSPLLVSGQIIHFFCVYNFFLRPFFRPSNSNYRFFSRCVYDVRSSIFFPVIQLYSSISSLLVNEVPPIFFAF